MVQVAQAVRGPDYGQIAAQALGVYSGVKGEQRAQKQEEGVCGSPPTVTPILDLGRRTALRGFGSTQSEERNGHS